MADSESTGSRIAPRLDAAVVKRARANAMAFFETEAGVDDGSGEDSRASVDDDGNPLPGRRRVARRASKDESYDHDDENSALDTYESSFINDGESESLLTDASAEVSKSVPASSPAKNKGSLGHIGKRMDPDGFLARLCAAGSNVTGSDAEPSCGSSAEDKDTSDEEWGHPSDSSDRRRAERDAQHGRAGPPCDAVSAP
jgi:hypothetical protein